MISMILKQIWISVIFQGLWETWMPVGTKPWRQPMLIALSFKPLQNEIENVIGNISITLSRGPFL